MNGSRPWFAPLLAMSLAVAAATAGCGQKGALYLPKRGTVVTRPASAQPGADAPTQTPETRTAAPAASPAPPGQNDKKDDQPPKP